MFIDTHCHLTMLGSDVVKEASDAGVDQIITIATNLKDSINSIQVAKEYENVFATVGIHPCDVTPKWRDDFKQIENLLKNIEQNKIVGLGETGLDFYHKPFDKQLQIDLFQAHIESALRYDLPLVVHMRESADDVLKILEAYQGKLRGNKLRGVAHCFLQNKQIADRLIEMGFYLGIGGPITYPKNNELRELFKIIPLDDILLETDAPFLPPQPYRGKKNHPKYIPLIAQELANLRGIELSVISDKTTANAKRLFRI